MSTRRILLIIVILTFGMNALTGCQRARPLKPVTITVSYPSAQQFYVMFGYAFEKAHPHINIQVIQDGFEGDDDDLFDTEADVMYINGIEQYKAAIERGKLRQIPPAILGETANSGALSPIVATLLASASEDGHYYALAPAFHSEALYFNKKIFDKYQLPYPHDGMLWSDVFALAERVPAENEDGSRLYGIQMNYSRNVTMNYILKAGETEGLSYLDPKTLQVTMNTDRWRSIWETAVQAFRAGAVYDKEEDADSMQRPAFLTGHAAMTISSNALAYDFEVLSHFDGGTEFDWGVVTAPVDPLNPDITNFYEIYDYFGVSSASEHPEEAMELVRFIAGDALNSRLVAANYPNYGLPAVTEYIHPAGDHDLSPLYSLQANSNRTAGHSEIEAEIVAAFQTAAQSILNSLLQNEITLDEALVKVELQGQEAVDAAVLELERNRQAE
ncbi:ABC transporter substrate-binding protein [Paenibacillus fonticola]|uniref:ABC transporter substrate-binding protein n=1 Tax=Paenibacillus fonticola TaxID=379896 RepID=UPI00037989FD|nr:extracellular solute-binding protein [Paenibacillus fonticola]